MTLGQYMKTKRLEAGWTLRLFCKRNNFDIRKYSEMEQDMIVPDEAELQRYMSVLGISKDDVRDKCLLYKCTLVAVQPTALCYMFSKDGMEVVLKIAATNIPSNVQPFVVGEYYDNPMKIAFDCQRKSL